MHQDTKSARLITVCKRAFTLSAQSIYEVIKHDFYLFCPLEDLRNSIFG